LPHRKGHNLIAHNLLAAMCPGIRRAALGVAAMSVRRDVEWQWMLSHGYTQNRMTAQIMAKKKQAAASSKS
jgi:DNA-binding transcriptional regulator YdaS (Cro superfamily)